MLHCLQNTVKGGTSLFLDLFVVIDKLRKDYPKEYSILTKVPVRFSYENDGKYFEYLRPTIVEDANDEIHAFYSPPFQGPLHCAPEDVSDFYHAFSIFESLIEDESLLYKYLMKEGDLVLFANRRVLHGRDSFDPTSGNRWLKGTYVGWDEVKDRIRVHLK
jgi:gamma-butyrobetaine dioxygenase